MTDQEASPESNSEARSTSSYSGQEATSTNENGSSQKSPDDLNVETIKVQLSKKETQAVARLRLIFLIIKLFVAGAVAFVIYHITSKAERMNSKLNMKAFRKRFWLLFLELLIMQVVLLLLGKLQPFTV